MPFKVKNRKKLKVAVYCLLTAATFWFFNTMGNRYVTDVHFPVHYVHADNLIVEQSIDYIIVSVSGTGWNILNNQLGFKINPVEIILKESGRYEIKTVGYSTFIRSELDGLEMKQIITEQLYCKVIKTND